MEPAKTITAAYQQCDFDHPLKPDDARWQDLSEGRGDQSTMRLERGFRHKKTFDPLHAVFAAHRGAGKTTELLRMCKRLGNAYHSLHFETNVELDPFSLEAEDLLLALAHAVVSELHELDASMDSEAITAVTSWFDEVVRTSLRSEQFTVEATAGVSGEVKSALAGLLTGFKAILRTESEYREEVRSVMRKFPGTLLDSVNQLLDEANRILHEEAGKQLLIVIDNLDRYPPEIIDRLLVRGGDRIRALRCNLILTPPISLIYLPITETLDRSFVVHVMNTVLLRTPDQPYTEFSGPGRDLMEKALGKRIHLDTLIPEQAVRDRILAASGGAVREMLEIVRSAILEEEETSGTISAESVKNALMLRRSGFRDKISANGWQEVLQEIQQSKNLSDDPKCMRVLFYRLAFKYNHGGWYDIHPLVAELSGFGGTG